MKLRFPLVQKWQGVQGFSPLLPVVAGGRVFLKIRGAIAVLDEASGEPLETLTGRHPATASDRRVILSSGEGLVSRELDSGREHRFGGTSGGLAFLLRDQRLYVQGSDLRCLDVGGGVLWKRPWETEFPPSACIFAATEREVVYGLDSGDVVCVSSANGEETWRHSVSDLPWFSTVDTKCYPTGTLTVYKDRVIVQARGRFVVGLDLKTGKRVWTYKSRGFVDCALLDGRCYVVGFPYAVLEPTNGQPHLEAELERPKEIPGAQGGINGPAAVSETHVYCATHFGPIIAWERETGRLAGLIKGKGACGSATIAKYLLIKNGRLYYADASLSVFCFEEVNPTDPILKRQRAEAKSAGLGDGVITAGVLDFSRVKAAPRTPTAVKKASSKGSVKGPSRKGSPAKRNSRIKSAPRRGRKA